MKIKFYVQGNPKGQPRPKAFSRGGIASVYDPGTAEGWKGQVAVGIAGQIPSAPIEGPLCLHLEFYFSRPKSHFGTGKKASVMRPDAPGYHTGRPDADNLAKAVMDALSVLRVWKDDAQVCHLIVRKLYDDGRGPGCIVEIADFLREHLEL
jgi:Holliday junction resolvase RusA-like endonuclease